MHDEKARMAEIEALREWIEAEAKALGLSLVRVAWFGGEGDRTLQVMAERSETRQLSIDDCAALSRRISERLDLLEAEGNDPIDEAYRLEVSSPGIDRPLTRLADYADWAGHDAKIALVEKQDGRKQANGVIKGHDGDIILVETRDCEMRVPFANIAAAKLVLTDRLIAQTAPLSIEGAEPEFETEDQD